MITLTVNNTDYEVLYVDTLPVWSRNRTESESDYAELVIRTDEDIDWRIYSPAEIDGEQYVVQGYKLVRKGINHYEYSVTLTENIDYFTQIIPESRPFSSWIEDGELQQYTIGSILEIYKQTIGYYKRILIDFDSGNPEYDTTVNSDVMDGDNLKEILMKLFDRIDAIPRVMRNDNTWFIYYEKYSARSEPIDLEGGYGYQREFNNSEYGTSMYVQAKNAIYRKPVWYPSSTGYVHPRSENRIYKQSEAKITLPSKIAEVDNLIAVDVEVRYYDEEEETYYTEIENIDITEQLVTKEQFDVIDQVGNTQEKEGQKQANTLYYTPGANDIEHLYVADGGILAFWSQDVKILYNAVFTAWQRQRIKDGHTIESGEGPTEAVEDVAEWKFRIKYKQLRDSTMDIERQNVDNMTKSQVPSQQNAGQIDLDRFAKNQMGAINRIANPMRETYIYTKPGERLPQLGDYDGNWIVVYVRHTVATTYTKSHVMATKNFNNLKAHYAINRTLSPYTISQPSIVTNTVSKTYLELSKQKKQHTDTYLTDKARKALLTFENGGYGEEGYIDTGGVFTSNENPDSLYIESAVTAQDGHISVHVQYDSRSRAGMKLDINETFWTTKRTLVPVRYTDSEGRMQYFDLKLGYGLGLQDDYDFPVITDNIEPLINIQNAPSLLDSNAIFAHTHHISIVTDNADEIVVVRNFAFLNQIVNEGALIEYRVYGSDVPFNIFNDKVRSSDDLLPVSVEWSSTDYALRLTSSIQESHWALADTDGNILAAFNNYQDTEWVYFNYTGGREQTGLVLIILNGAKHVQSYDVWGLVSAQPSIDLRGDDQVHTYTLDAGVEAYQSGYDVKGPGQSYVFNMEATISVETSQYLEADNQTHDWNMTATINYAEPATDWDYIGTSGNDDDQVNAGLDDDCRSSSEIQTWLDTNYPPEDYIKGFIMRVNHQKEDNGNIVQCIAYYYEAIKN